MPEVRRAGSAASPPEDRQHEMSDGRPARAVLMLAASLAIGLGVTLGMVGMEIALRMLHGELLSTRSLRPGAREPQGTAAFAHHPLLGHVPAPGNHSAADGTMRTIDARGLRSSGVRIPGDRVPILAVGDSFTFGDEVDDGETWPAHLERLLARPVANAGVSAYGMDQAVLRALQLDDTLNPELVILGVISADIHRCEMSHRTRWKPWHTIEAGGLVLRGVPVPEEHRGAANDDSLLSRSFLVHAIARRLFPGWWYLNEKRIEHGDGDAVARLLLDRLHDQLSARGASLVLLTLVGRDLDTSRLPALVEHARARGIQVVDLAEEIRLRALANPSRSDELFRPRGHLTGTHNGWVADRLAGALGERVARVRRAS